MRTKEQAHTLAVAVVTALLTDITTGVFAWRWSAMSPERQANVVSNWQRLAAEAIKQHETHRKLKEMHDADRRAVEAIEEATATKEQDK